MPKNSKPEINFEARNVIVLSATPTAGIKNLAEKASSSNGVVQFFDPAAIASRLHVIGAYANAINAFRCKTNRSKSVAMEMLLFAALTRQIKNAVETAGAKANCDILIFAESKKSLRGISKYLKNVHEFAPNAMHRERALKLLGLDAHTSDIELLQAMAICMLRY